MNDPDIFRRDIVNPDNNKLSNLLHQMRFTITNLNNDTEPVT